MPKNAQSDTKMQPENDKNMQKQQLSGYTFGPAPASNNSCRKV